MAFLDPQKIYSYFDSLFSLTESSAGWYIFKCPFCNELEERKKMAVHPQYGCVKCWVCGYKEYVVNFIMGWENLTYSKSVHLLQDLTASKVTFEIENTNNYINAEVVLPVGFTPLLMGSGSLGKRARKALESRGFDLVQLDMAGFGYCNAEVEEGTDDYFGYIIIPFYSYGKLTYFIGRDFIGNYLRYKNPSKATFGVGKADVWFNEDAFYIHDEVFCLEGALDAQTMGENAAASCGWKLSKRQLGIVLNSPCTKICLVPDAGTDKKDGTGEYFYIKALQLAHQLIDHKEVKVLDLNVLGCKADANSVGIDAIMDIYNKTPYEDFLSLVEKQMDYET